MKRQRKELRQPYGRGDYELHRGPGGVYWQAGHGVRVRLAAPDREPEEWARPVTPALGLRLVRWSR